MSISSVRRLGGAWVYSGIGACCLVAASCAKQTSLPAAALTVTHFATVQWSPALPGIEVAVLSGNPEAAGQPYAILIKCSDGAGTKPHRHPTDGTAVVLQGTYLLGLGETFDTSKQQALTVGDYVYLPKSVAHFDSCKGETVLYAHGVGPLEFNWVNPADDPSKRGKS